MLVNAGLAVAQKLAPSHGQLRNLFVTSPHNPMAANLLANSLISQILTAHAPTGDQDRLGQSDHRQLMAGIYDLKSAQLQQ